MLENQEVINFKNNHCRDITTYFLILIKIEFKEFWSVNDKKLIRLSSVFKEVSIIMGTSCPSESTFSIAGYLQRKARSNLSSKNLRFSILSKEIEKIRELMKLYGLSYTEK